MKFCPKCGKQLEDNMKFCGGCGATLDAAPQEAPQAVPPQAAPQQSVMQQQINNFQNNNAAPKKPNPLKPMLDKLKANKKIVGIAGGALVGVVVLIVVLVNVTKYQKVDAKDIFTVEFDGLNNYGTAEAKFAAYDSDVYDKFDNKAKYKKMGYDLDPEDYEKEGISPYFSINEDEFTKAWSKAKDKKEAIKMRNALLKKNKKGNYLVKCTIEGEPKDLKNGDKVKCKVECDDEYLKQYKIKVTNKEFEVEVKNLDEGIEFDPFDEKYVKVSFTGRDGNGYVDVSTTSDTPSAISYDYGWDSGYLKNGDTFTVSAYCYRDIKPAGDKFFFESDEKYYVISSKEMKKEYKVEGLEQLTELDPFENLEFEYSNGTPFLTVNRVVKDKLDKNLLDNVDYTLENYEGLKVGDKFKVKAYAYSGLANSGYQLKGTPDSDGYYVKEFTVDDTMPKYVTKDDGKKAYDSFKTLDDEITEIRKRVTSSRYISSKTLNGEPDSITSFELADVYVAFNNKTSYESIDWWSDYINRIIGVYEIKVKTDDEETGEDSLVAVIYCDNITVANGTYSEPDFRIEYYEDMEAFRKDMVKIEGYSVTSTMGDNPEEKKDESKAEEDSKAEESKAEDDTESKAEDTEESKEEEETESEAEEETEESEEEE